MGNIAFLIDEAKRKRAQAAVAEVTDSLLKQPNESTANNVSKLRSVFQVLERGNG